MPRSYKSKNILDKINNSRNGLLFSLEDYSVRLAYYFSIPISIIFFFLAPNLLTKLLASFIFLFWIVFESLNTTIETIVDRISMKRHPLSKIAKDIPSYINALFVLFFIFSVIMLAFITKYDYDEWSTLNPDKNLNDYIYQSFRK